MICKSQCSDDRVKNRANLRGEKSCKEKVKSEKGRATVESDAYGGAKKGGREKWKGAASGRRCKVGEKKAEKAGEETVGGAFGEGVERGGGRQREWKMRRGEQRNKEKLEVQSEGGRKREREKGKRNT